MSAKRNGSRHNDVRILTKKKWLEITYTCMMCGGTFQANRVAMAHLADWEVCVNCLPKVVEIEEKKKKRKVRGED